MSGETALARWLKQQFGPDRRFKSARHLAVAAGLSQGIVNIILERGHARPETLLKLADALEVPSERLFAIAGWLRDEHSDAGSSWELSADEAELLKRYRELPREGKTWLIGSLQGMLQLVQRSK
jgi:hypothetical protein